MFKDTKKDVLKYVICAFYYTLNQSAHTVATVLTAVFVLILQTNIEKNKKQKNRHRHLEKDKLCPAVQQWQLEFTSANHQGATKVLELPLMETKSNITKKKTSAKKLTPEKSWLCLS